MGLWAPSDWSDGREDEAVQRLAARLRIAAAERGEYLDDRDAELEAASLVRKYGEKI